MNEATPDTKKYVVQYKWKDGDPASKTDGNKWINNHGPTDMLTAQDQYKRDAAGPFMNRSYYRLASWPQLEVLSSTEPSGYVTPPKADAKPLKLPTDDKERKGLPVFRGPLMYFPNALLEVARVCKVGNDQHNPGQPMHWARGKSTEQMDTALRHMMDHGLGNTRDVDGTYHLAKAAWRILAELQLTIERDAEEGKAQ